MEVNQLMKFMIDEFEGYSSYNEAALEFSRNIALESTYLDIAIQLEFGLTDDDVFSDYALENIANTVANMASKAKSNIILYSKKLINMLFGWLVNFFKGGANLKQIMKNNYDKARKYLKKLNEFESKIRAMDQEKEISIRDNGSCVIIGLTVIQVIKTALDNVQDGIKGLAGRFGNEADNGEAASDVETAFATFLALMSVMYSTLGNINISNAKDLKNTLRANKWNVANILNSAATDSSTKADGEFERAGKVAKKETDNAKKKYRIVSDEEERQKKMSSDFDQAEADSKEEKVDKMAREKNEKEKQTDSALESINWFKYVGSRISMEAKPLDNVTEGIKKEAIDQFNNNKNNNNKNNNSGAGDNGGTTGGSSGGSGGGTTGNNTGGGTKPLSDEELDKRAKARNERKAERKKSIITEKEWNAIKNKISLEKQMGVVEKFRGEYKNKVEETIKYMEEPTSADMSPNQAFDVLRDQLNTYIEFSKANQWNLDQYVKIAEKMRRDMDKVLGNFDAENSDETVVKEMMTAVLTLGNSFASMQSGVNGIVKRLKGAMDNIFTDTMKLGSAATKIGSSV